MPAASGQRRAVSGERSATGGQRRAVSDGQLTRAARSIATNIVEGRGAATHKEFARYLDISIKSANETEYHLLSAHELELISDADFEKHTKEVIEIRKMIYAYHTAPD